MKRFNLLLLLLFSIFLISGCNKSQDNKENLQNDIKYYEVRSYLEKND